MRLKNIWILGGDPTIRFKGIRNYKTGKMKRKLALKEFRPGVQPFTYFHLSYFFRMEFNMDESKINSELMLGIFPTV